MLYCTNPANNLKTIHLVCECLLTSLPRRLKIVFYITLQLNIRKAKYLVYFVPG